MKIQPRRNKAMAVATFVIVIVLVVIIILGVAYLIAKVQKFAQKITPPPPPDDPSFVQPMLTSSPARLLSSNWTAPAAEDVQTPFGSITLPPGQVPTNNLVHFWIEATDTNGNWTPLTNFYCTVDEIERVWQVPIDLNLPARFFRIGAGEPTQ